jgi:hypothetical protein
MRGNILIVILLASITASCLKDIEIDVKQATQQLVINSWLRVGQIPEVQLSRSEFILSNNELQFITDASSVKLFEDGLEIANLQHVGNGVYRNQNVLIKSEKRYEVRVSHPQFGEVFAESTMPQPIDPSVFEWQLGEFRVNNSGFGWQDETTELKFIIKDKSQMPDFFALFLRAEEKYWNELLEDTFRTNYTVWFNYTDLGFVEDAYLDNLSMLLVNNRAALTNRYEFTVNVWGDVRRLLIESEFEYIERTHELEYAAITEDFYRYLVSVRDNGIQNPFTEPMPIFSNVENGFGILALSDGKKEKIMEPSTQNPNQP